MVPKSQQHDEIATNLFFGGMLREEIGGFHPGKFFAGLLRKTEDAGAIICAKTVVKDISEMSKGRKSVITSKGNLAAEKVIVATNAYTGTKHPFSKFLRRRLVPVQSCIIVTEALGQAKIKELMPKLRMYGNTANLYGFLRPTPDRDRLLLGLRSFDQNTPSEKSVANLKNKLTQIFPEVSDCGIDYCWLENVAFTRSQLPAIFENNQIYYAVGYAGSGTLACLNCLVP